jgi:hypothetical protein
MINLVIKCLKSQESKRHEFAKDLESTKGKKNIFRIAKQMAKERQDVVGVNCLKSDGGNIVIDPDEIQNVWKRYMEKLLNEENAGDGITDSSSVLGPRLNITNGGGSA